MVKLPRRQVVQNSCLWKYRGSSVVGAPSEDMGCNYTGPNMDVNDILETSTNPMWIGIDKCSKRLSSCKARFGPLAPLPYGGFPGAVTR